MAVHCIYRSNRLGIRVKVCIVALDALEYELVQKFYCENLKQSEYGKIDLAEFKQQSPTGEPFTPVIWSSFITGLMPVQTEIKVKRFYRNPIMEALQRLVFRFRLEDKIVDMMSIWRKEWIKEKILGPIGLSKTLVGVEEAWKIDREYFKGKKLKTIFDFSENSLIIAMPAYKPYYGEGWKVAKDFISGKITRKEFLRKEIDILEKEINDAIILLDRNWDLFVFYTHTIDSVGHFLAWDTRAMWHLYERVDNFVKELGRRIGDNSFILVISDHGMKRTGMHSDYAFYSINTRLNLKNPKITDFYDIIIKKLTTK